ncbi:sterol-sensing domain of SREBP cleavage-activation-domain-containing protein [Coniella lustricola]|uniref:Sterol regulatory element-binding protein cleavage-activating protein n=1 Tax=Coniella lustricola TaxID=2025994 RepID=A0A2T3A1J1_9PEZI|nr:sterol-sensing domain of SREBP cleavage-activation-domain-containing protein [Coniella lustricola]
MIWYLLYPFRGTTEAPILSPSHPLRSILTRYGRYAARHVLTTLLISVAVAGTLIYPFPFLYTTDFTNAASNLPLHVWTDAQPLDYKHFVEPDVIMRSVWIHGSYMKALDRDVILGALDVQDALLGPTTNFNPRRLSKTNDPFSNHLSKDLSRDERDEYHVVNGLTNQSWFFHSPLQYWSCDADKIAADENFLDTVNEKKTQSTSVNVTLRHSIVFSGKTFEDRKLVAADALVITLLHLRDSPVGRQWEKKTADYASHMATQWDVFPSNGVSTGSQLYEFQFRPISMQDKVLLSLAYLLTAGYFLLSLSKVRAVKSKLGLMVTVVAQIAMAILSSLTICAFLQIDLSRIPRAAYPLVLMAMSLENIFRLINAVILTPADHKTSSRIGQAFGETGHIALAGVAQNLLMLWGLSKYVSSGVSAFCTFAGIAILFDFFYLSTFFLSVLSVDVRRTELHDSLEKTTMQNHQQSPESQPRRSVIDAVLKGKIALSTRIAGTIVMLGFILIAQWHFLDSESTHFNPMNSIRFFWKNASEDVASAPPYAGLHQARSPQSWLRLQDHETAKEVINVIKPSAHSYIARVYDPVVFVFKGSDRMPPQGIRWLPDAAHDFAHRQLLPFTVTVVVAIALVRLFMNYLLWDEMAEVGGEYDFDDQPLISVRSLGHGHDLDITKLAVTPDCHVVSVGLDRTIRVWNLHYNFASYVLDRPSSPINDPFPIFSMTMDEESNWLAILSQYRVLFWDLSKQTWGPSVAVELYGHKPEAFFFGSTRKNGVRSVVVVRHNGTMVELWPETNYFKEYVICRSSLSCVIHIVDKGPTIHPDSQSSLISLSRHGCVHRVVHHNGMWVSTEVKLWGKIDQLPQNLLAVQTFSSYMVIWSQSVDLVDLNSSKIIHTFTTEPMQSRSLRFVYRGHRNGPTKRGTVSSMTLAYISSENGDCVIQTYFPEDEYENIWFSTAAGLPSRSSCGWNETKLVVRRIENPGSWTPLRNGCIMGVRRVYKNSHDGSTKGRIPTFASSGLRRRGHVDAPHARLKSTETWETWVLTRLEQEGNYETRPLLAPDAPAALMITELGPMVKVGYGSAAVGFGNDVKIITLGNEWFDEHADESPKNEQSMTSRRKRRAPSKPRAPSTLLQD